MDDIQTLVPRIHKMRSHKCQWCGLEVLDIPGELQMLFCYGEGFQHNANTPNCPKLVKCHKVTIYDYKGDVVGRFVMNLEKED